MSNKKSDTLFILIKSLSKSEKRFFKLYASRHTSSEENNYIRLFEFLEKQPAYESKNVFEFFKGESFLKKYSIATARLYKVILKSLHAFHADSSIDAILKRELHYAEILYDRTLYKQCQQLLRSIKKTAVKHEKYSVLSDVSSWEKKIMETKNYAGESDYSITSILEEDISIAEIMKNFNEFWNIKSRFFLFLNKQGKVRNETELIQFKNAIDNVLLKSESKALSLETKFLYYHIYSAYYFGIDDYLNCYQNLIKNIELVEKHPRVFREKPNIYFSILSNAIYIANQLKQHDQAFLYLKKLREIPILLHAQKNQDLAVKLFSTSYSIELALYKAMGEFSSAVELIPAINNGLEEFSANLTKLRKADFYFNMAAVCFGDDKHSLALKWLNKLLNDIQIEETQDIYCFAKILDLIVHIELKNTDLIPYALKSTERYLKSRNRVYKFEEAFLNFFSAALKTSAGIYNMKNYKELYEKIAPLQDDRFEKTVFEYFDFISWVESKIRKKSFVLIIKNKLNNT